MKISNLIIFSIALIAIIFGAIYILNNYKADEKLSQEFEYNDVVDEPKSIYNLYRAYSKVNFTDSQYLYSNETLPKQYIFGNESLIVKGVEIKEGNLFYLIVSYKGKEERLWLDGIRGAFNSFDTYHKEDEINSTITQEAIAIIEVDYSPDTNKWNYIKFGKLRIEEFIPPNTIS